MSISNDNSGMSPFDRLKRDYLESPKKYFDLQEKLKTYETQYGMSTDQFIDLYVQAKLPETNDFNEWYILGHDWNKG